jgi:hypothetical protein
MRAPNRIKKKERNTPKTCSAFFIVMPSASYARTAIHTSVRRTRGGVHRTSETGVQRVVGVRRQAALRVGESGAVGGRVVAIRVGEVVASQEAVARRRADQAAHRVRAILVARRNLVVGERVRCRRIVHLLDFSYQVVDVIDSLCIWIAYARDSQNRTGPPRRMAVLLIFSSP